jgi:hypothetical protein
MGKAPKSLHFGCTLAFFENLQERSARRPNSFASQSRANESEKTGYAIGRKGWFSPPARERLNIS